MPPKRAMLNVPFGLQPLAAIAGSTCASVWRLNEPRWGKARIQKQPYRSSGASDGFSPGSVVLPGHSSLARMSGRRRQRVLSSPNTQLNVRDCLVLAAAIIATTMTAGAATAQSEAEFDIEYHLRWVSPADPVPAGAKWISTSTQSRFCVEGYGCLVEKPVLVRRTDMSANSILRELHDLSVDIENAVNGSTTPGTIRSATRPTARGWPPMGITPHRQACMDAMNLVLKAEFLRDRACDDHRIPNPERGEICEFGNEVVGAANELYASLGNCEI